MITKSTREAELKTLRSQLKDAEYDSRQAEDAMHQAEDTIDEIKQEIEAIENGHTPGKVLDGCLPFHLAAAGYVLIETKEKKEVLENKEGEIVKTWDWMPSLTDLMEIR